MDRPADSATAAPIPTATTPAPPTDAAGFAIDGLPEGTHLGVATFSPPEADRVDDWAALWERANEPAAIGRIQLDWIDVEPERGGYDLTDLTEKLNEITDAGQAPMVSIIATDISGTDFPEWLGGFEPVEAATAYNDMLDEVAPLLQRHDVWFLSVANEPPFEDGLDPTQFGRFLAPVREHMRTVLPATAFGFTFAGGDITSGDPEIEALVELVDVFSVNHYCLEPDLRVIDIEDTETAIDRAVATAGGRPVVFQEFGCPAAESMGSSEDFQAAWFERAFTAIEANPQVRAAFVFEFYDWSVELVEQNYGDAFEAEPEFADFFGRLRDWLLTTGMVRRDMTTRPAFDVYLTHLGQDEAGF